MNPPHPTSPSPPTGPAQAPADDLGTYLEEAMRDPAFRGAYHDACARSHLVDELIKLRTAQGITQAQAAQQMRTSRPLITRLESGRTDPHLSTLQRYARALGGHLTITLVPGPPTSAPGQDIR